VVRSVRVCDISEQNLVPSIPMQSSNMIFSVMVLCMYSGENDICDDTLSVYPHRASLKNMPGHGGNRTYDLWNTSTALPANRHTLAHGILGFLIMRVPKSDAQRNICLVSGIYFI
jgi:hypothetical protein